jgi:hypothetical protein
MKTIAIYLVAMVLVLPAGAQTFFDELVKKYVDVEGFSAVQLTNDMFGLYLKKKDIKADDPVYKVLDDLDNMMVITQTFTGSDSTSKEKLKTEIRNHYQGNGYSLFKTEKKPNSDLKIYISKKADEGIKSMGLLSSNSFSVNLIEMNGKIDLGKVATLSNALNIRGLEQLRAFDNNSAPNNFYFNYQFDMPDLKGFELSEERQKEIEEHVKKAQEAMESHQFKMLENQKELGERQKEIFEKYHRHPIFFSGPGEKDAEYYVNGKKVDFDEVKKIMSDDVQSVEVIKKDGSKREKSEIKIQLKSNK